MMMMMYKHVWNAFQRSPPRHRKCSSLKGLILSTFLSHMSHTQWFPVLCNCCIEFQKCWSRFNYSHWSSLSLRFVFRVTFETNFAQVIKIRSKRSTLTHLRIFNYSNWCQTLVNLISWFSFFCNNYVIINYIPYYVIEGDVINYVMFKYRVFLMF